jgi:uncharacterized delta-60 repeat protein
MKAKFLLRGRFLWWMMGSLALGGGTARAQGPTIDPTFQATTVYKPASVEQVLQQPDGKRLVLGSYADGIVRAGSQPAGKMARLLANSNEPDTAFTRNVRGLQGTVRFMMLMPSGQVLVVGYDALTLGAVTRQYLLRLNADGTPDAGFDAGFPASSTPDSPVFNGVGQPDGKLVLSLMHPLLAGAGRLIRLLPNGALDTAFQAALTSTVPGTANPGGTVVLQPDGKLLVPPGYGANGPLRLLPTGALDTSFTPQMALPTGTYISQMAVQPDGKVVVATYNYSTTTPRPLVRLTATGAPDPTFQSPVGFSFNNPFLQAPQVQVQADGKLLVNTLAFDASNSVIGWVVRLLPDGGLDAGFDANASVGTGYVNDTQLLPNGQVLVVKQTGNRHGLPLYRLLLLNTDGSQDVGFAPRLFAMGQVNDVVQVPGGGYVVGGQFSEINGVAASNLARLSAAGVPAPAFVDADGEVRSLLVQPDGKLLVGGAFEHLHGASRRSLGRLLASGALDVSFAPPFLSTNSGAQPSSIERLALLPDGRVLASGITRLASSAALEDRLRLLDAATGQPDLSLPAYTVQNMVVQPSGKVVIAGFAEITAGAGSQGYSLFRLLPSGTLDPTFGNLPSIRYGLGGGPLVTALTQDDGGNLLFCSYSFQDVTPTTYNIALTRVSPDGFNRTSVYDGDFYRTACLAVQPNGRVLVGATEGSTPLPGLRRLLPTLAPDLGFQSANGPAPTVNRLLVQSDGAIMAAGSFTAVGGQPISGLVRLLDANVLSVAARQLALRTEAWPVPAHEYLHLNLDAASQPRRVELLDALGRVVLAQPAPPAELTLDTRALAAGAYVLRVHYAAGPVTRRVVLE